MASLVYIAGYGRSGSTLLGAIMAREQRKSLLGEVHNISRHSFTTAAHCSCGSSFTTCALWRNISRDLRSALAPSPLRGRVMRLLEGAAGLFVPMPMLRLAVRRLPASTDFAGITYCALIEAIAREAGDFVDTSKTTRLTANRPRLLHACGHDVELMLPARPLVDVTTSYASAQRRAGHRVPGFRARLFVPASLGFSRLAAKICAWSLGRTLEVRRFDDIISDIPTANELPAPLDHLIGGNRRQLRSEES